MMPASTRVSSPSALVLSVLAIAGCSRNASESAATCASGAYRLESGELLILSPSDEGTLRYRFMDGRSGRLYPQPNGTLNSGEGWAVREPVIVTARCSDAASLEWKPVGGEESSGARLPLRETFTRFERDGLAFHARLVLPEAEPRAIVVFAHGSGRDPATLFSAHQYLLPAFGIGVLVFDKRGTGQSGGEYTQDFDMLAQDLVAAVSHAHTLVRADVPFGIMGESQGGWIAPLAATKTAVDFVIASYGLAEGPLAEDREEVQSELRALGYGADVLAEARLVTDASGRVMASRFKDGYEELAAVKQRFGAAPWLEEIHGEFTGDLLRYPAWILRIAGPWRDVGTPWEYDPVPALERVSAPMLWVLGGKDTEAPSATTLAILKSLQARPAQLDIAHFPNADHGIIEVKEGADGRSLVGHSPGYLELLVHWILERNLGGSFGSAELFADSALPPQ